MRLLMPSVHCKGYSQSFATPLALYDFVCPSVTGRVTVSLSAVDN